LLSIGDRAEAEIAANLQADHVSGMYVCFPERIFTNDACSDFDTVLPLSGKFMMNKE
jgi:hypothetical protein